MNLIGVDIINPTVCVRVCVCRAKTAQVNHRGTLSRPLTPVIFEAVTCTARRADGQTGSGGPQKR